MEYSSVYLVHRVDGAVDQIDCDVYETHSSGNVKFYRYLPASKEKRLYRLYSPAHFVYLERVE